MPWPQPSAAYPPDCPVHDRFMIKRAQGRKRFGMKNFKKRWFRLTNHEFTYQKSKGTEARGQSLVLGPVGSRLLLG